MTQVSERAVKPRKPEPQPAPADVLWQIEYAIFCAEQARSATYPGAIR